MLFDTNILIDFLRQRSEAMDLLEAQEEKPCISAVSVLELYAGVSGRREEAAIERLLTQARLLSVTGNIAKRAGALMRVYRPSHTLEALDAIIAATAEHHELKLATLNAKHFPMFPKLKKAY